MDDADEPDLASPACSLSEAPPDYALARALSPAELASLLDGLILEASAIERRLRESLPLVEEATKTALGTVADRQRDTVAALQQLRDSLPR